MNSGKHPWDEIFKNEGWPYFEPFPRFGEIVQVLRAHHCSKILDLGCGNGRHTIYLEKEGFQIVGMDISTSGLRLTQDWQTKEGTAGDLVLADARIHFPFRNNCFNGLFSTQVIHHAKIGEIRRTIKEIWRILSSGGIAFVTVSGKMDEKDVFEEIEPDTFVPLTGPEKGLPHHIFSVAELRAEFHDFHIKDISVVADGHVIKVLARKPG